MVQSAYEAFQPQIDLAVILTIFVFFSTEYVVSRPNKNTLHGVLDFLNNFLGLISPRITQNTGNDTVGLYRFRWHFGSKFYVRKEIYFLSHERKWARLWLGSYEEIIIKKKL